MVPTPARWRYLLSHVFACIGLGVPGHPGDHGAGRRLGGLIFSGIAASSRLHRLLAVLAQNIAASRWD